MTYQVLARKWRPQNFHSLVGQDHVLRTLIHALDAQRLHHAYLFTGTRGVGKTTIARILARCLNCEEGITSTPCGTCPSCTEITEGRFVDLIEVDAASRTKVEDTRELLENVQYAPTRGRFKVYLIDEVHMLTGHSFNALLKTLEEPPPHVKFILATTDPQKLPITVLSRCLQFGLKNITVEKVVDYLRDILTQEAIGFDEGSLWQLGRAAKGSMRDALSITDQAIGYCGAQLQETQLNQMLGTIDQGRVISMLEALRDNDASALLQCVAHLVEHGQYIANASEDLQALLHQVAICQVVPDAPIATQFEEGKVRRLAEEISPADIQLFYELGVQAHKDLDKHPNMRHGFEMNLLRMLAFRPQHHAHQMGTIDVATQAAVSAPIADNVAAVQTPVITPADTPVQAQVTTPIESQPSVQKVTPVIAASPSQDLVHTTTQRPFAEQPQGHEQHLTEDQYPEPSMHEQPITPNATPKSTALLDDVPPWQDMGAEPVLEEQTLEKQVSAPIAPVPAPQATQDLDPNLDQAPAPVAGAMQSTPPIAMPQAQRQQDDDVEITPTEGVPPAPLDDETFNQQQSTVPDSTWTLADLNESSWPQLFDLLNLTGPSYAIASNLVFSKRSGTQLVFLLDPHHSSILNAQCQGNIRQALEKLFACDLQLSIDVKANGDEAEYASPVAQSPWHVKALEKKALQQKNKEAIKQDPFAQQLEEVFNGTFVDASIGGITTDEKHS